MKIKTFFLKNSLILILKLLVYQNNAGIHIFPIKWIKHLLFLVAIISYEIKRDKWILLYFFILFYNIEFLFYYTFINWSVTIVFNILRISCTFQINIFLLFIALRDIIKVVILISLLTKEFEALIIEKSLLWTHLQTCFMKRNAYFLQCVKLLLRLWYSLKSSA